MANATHDTKTEITNRDETVDPTQSLVDPDEFGAVERDPDRWVTGDEAMTAPQASYLQTLAHEAGEEFDPSMSKADASKEIDRLQDVTGRGG